MLTNDNVRCLKRILIGVALTSIGSIAYRYPPIAPMGTFFTFFGTVVTVVNTIELVRTT